MSAEEPQQDVRQSQDVDSAMQDTSSQPASAPTGKRRPKLDLNALGAGLGERKRGKSMFGVLLNTLNKAKAEDKERSASEAAKKRQLLEQKLQNKLKKETDIVRRAEEAKKDKVTANRREEDLQLKDSVYKLRRTLLPQLANFLSTADRIPQNSEEDPLQSFQLSSVLPPRSHPPPIFYLPAKLTPEQEAFLSKRKELVKDLAEKEWSSFVEERKTGIEEIFSLRQKVAEEEQRKKEERENQPTPQKQEKENDPAPEENNDRQRDDDDENGVADMEVDSGKPDPAPESEKKEGGQEDDEEAVEY